MKYLKRSVDNTLLKAISNWGKNITIFYSSAMTCNSCSYDPITKQATNAFCSTCHGQYYYDTSKSFECKGVVKTFIGSMKHVDHALFVAGYLPEHEARVTCKMSDVVINKSSAEGRTYLDPKQNIRVEFNSKKYIVKGTYKAGAENLKIITATLEEIK